MANGLDLNLPVKNLCILRLSAIGDVCHAVAMVSEIRKQRPDIVITWIIGEVEYQLVKHLLNIRFVVYDKKAGQDAREQVKEQLADEKFDVLFVMQVALRANWLSTVINAKYRVGFDSERSREWHSLFVNKRIAPQRHPHVLDGFMGFANKIGVTTPQQPSWDLPLPDEDKKWVASLLSKPFVVISPAASKAERNWLAQRYAQIADYISNKGFEVVMCGGSGELDKSISQEIMSFTSNIHHNLVAKTTLTQLLCLLAKAKLVIAPDTGPAHMAVTQNTPVIGLYAHSNPRRTGPYNGLDLTANVYDDFVKKQYSKPWQNVAWGKRTKGKNLMAKIAVADVITLIDKVLTS